MMTNRQIRGALSTRLLLFGLLAGGLFYLGLNFARQASAYHQRRVELDLLEQEIVAAQAKLAQRQAELEAAQSPQAAEDWARGFGWAKPDESPVVLVAPPVEASPDTEGGAGQGGDPTSNRDAWWELFFGSR
jgi:hypothetical protein